MRRNASLTTLYVMTFICLAGGIVAIIFGVLFATTNDPAYMPAGIVLSYAGGSLFGFGLLTLLFSLLAHAIVRAIENRPVEQATRF